MGPSFYISAPRRWESATPDHSPAASILDGIGGTTILPLSICNLCAAPRFLGFAVEVHSVVTQHSIVAVAPMHTACDNCPRCLAIPP